MSGLVSAKSATEYPWDVFEFGQASAAKSQTAVALKMNVNDATSGFLSITGGVAMANGFIVGFSFELSANKTAGVFSATPTINGTALTAPTSLVAVTMTNATLKSRILTDYGQVGANFVAGDLIGLKITTDGSFAPDGTADLYARVYIVYDKVQI